MGEITLTLKESLAIPLEADTIRPDLFADMGREEIEALPLYYGNEQRRLGDLFEVEGERSDQLRIKGNLSRVKKIGYGMTGGRIAIEGDAGMHLGATMRGGEIVVDGNASDWLGAEMKGGLIRVKGNAGNFVGGSYHGSKRGMNRGTIIIGGNAGNEIGEKMRRGLIITLGDANDFVGANMIAGTIIVFGKVGEGPGAGMKRGTIVLFGGEHNPESLLPTFRYNCTYTPPFLAIYLRNLMHYDIEVPGEYIGGRYRRYNGDIAELGKGEILVYERD